MEMLKILFKIIRIKMIKIVWKSLDRIFFSLPLEIFVIFVVFLYYIKNIMEVRFLI